MVYALWSEKQMLVPEIIFVINLVQFDTLMVNCILLPVANKLIIGKKLDGGKKPQSFRFPIIRFKSLKYTND